MADRSMSERVEQSQLGNPELRRVINASNLPTSEDKLHSATATPDRHSLINDISSPSLETGLHSTTTPDLRSLVNAINAPNLSKRSHSNTTSDLRSLIDRLESLPLELTIYILDYLMHDDDLSPCLLSTFLPPNFTFSCHRDAGTDSTNTSTAVHSSLCNREYDDHGAQYQSCLSEFWRIFDFHPPQLTHKRDWTLIQYMKPGPVRRIAYAKFFQKKWFAISPIEEYALLLAWIRSKPLPFSLQSCLHMARNLFLPVFREHPRIPAPLDRKNPSFMGWFRLARLRVWHQPINDDCGATLAESAAFFAKTAAKDFTIKLSKKSADELDDDGEAAVRLQCLLPKAMGRQDFDYLTESDHPSIFPRPEQLDMWQTEMQPKEVP